MRNLERDPDRCLGLVEVDPAGESFRIARGFEGGGLPTSELMPHLCAHAARTAATGGSDRAIIHTHPQNLIALTYALELDTKRLTRLLWEMHTECIVVFPMGCGFVHWRMPGGVELAEATAKVLGRRTMAVWQHHGIVAAGPDLEHAFGLIETAEKAAEIYLKAAALGPVTRRLTTEQLAALAANFGVEPDREILHG
jgi:rhamnulose-1-phosphate aldolase